MYNMRTCNFRAAAISHASIVRPVALYNSWAVMNTAVCLDEGGENSLCDDKKERKFLRMRRSVSSSLSTRSSSAMMRSVYRGCRMRRRHIAVRKSRRSRLGESFVTAILWTRCKGCHRETSLSLMFIVAEGAERKRNVALFVSEDSMRWE